MAIWFTMGHCDTIQIKLSLECPGIHGTSYLILANQQSYYYYSWHIHAMETISGDQKCNDNPIYRNR